MFLIMVDTGLKFLFWVIHILGCDLEGQGHCDLEGQGHCDLEGQGHRFFFFCI